jgi:hypothetical protein
MTSTARIPALLLAARIVVAAWRPGLSVPRWLAKVRARVLRMASVAVAGTFVVVLALSLVGVNGGAGDRLPTIQVGVLASMAVAVLLIRGARASDAERR